MEETHQDSLISYLELNQKQLHAMLLASNLANLHGKQFWINWNQGHSSYIWQQFLGKHTLEGYFNWTTVTKKKYNWIGLESMKKKLAGSFNPATLQSSFFRTPPLRLPKSNQALLQKSRSMMLAALHLYNQEIEKNKLTDDDEDDDNLDPTMKKKVNNAGNGRDQETDKNLSNSYTWTDFKGQTHWPSWSHQRIVKNY
jgi:hypothetical protein